MATAARSVLALGLGVVLVARGGTEGRQVGPDRAALVEAALGQEQRALEIALGSELPRNEALRLARSVLTRKVGPKK